MSSNFKNAVSASLSKSVQLALIWMCVKIKDAYPQGGLMMCPIVQKLLCLAIDLLCSG